MFLSIDKDKSIIILIKFVNLNIKIINIFEDSNQKLKVSDFAIFEA